MSLIYLWDTQKEPFAPIDGLVKRWGDVVVPIFVENRRSGHAVNGLGSGFLLAHRDSLYLVTARHVVVDLGRFQNPIANLGGTAVCLSGLPFAVSVQYDIAVAYLSQEWLDANNLGALKALPAAQSVQEGWDATGVFLMVGYPGSKNELDYRYGKVNRYMLSITTEPVRKGAVETSVQDAVLLAYDHKRVVNSALQELGPQPALQGMSGGPALQVRKKDYSNGELRFSISFEGVLCEWHKRNRIVVAAPAFSVIELIEEKRTNPIFKPALETPGTRP